MDENRIEVFENSDSTFHANQDHAARRIPGQTDDMPVMESFTELYEGNLKDLHEGDIVQGEPSFFRQGT